jgi:hypothetical protein
MDNTEQETWRLTVDARLAALEAGLAALTMLSGKKTRKAVAAALETAAEMHHPIRIRSIAPLCRKACVPSLSACARPTGPQPTPDAGH